MIELLTILSILIGVVLIAAGITITGVLLVVLKKADQIRITIVHKHFGDEK